MDWDECYRLNETPWDRGEPAPPLVEYLERERIRGRVLVPGCGSGYDVRHLAEHGCDALGIDISPLALERAKAIPTPPGARLAFELRDFLDPGSGVHPASFDYIFEHTCFCAIDPSRRPDYVDAARRALKRGGHLLAILFTDMEEGEEGGPPYSSSADEIERLFSPHFVRVDSWKPNRVFPGRENEETMYRMQVK